MTTFHPRRFFAWLLALALLVPLLAACGGGEPPATAPEATTAPAAPATTEAPVAATEATTEATEATTEATEATTEATEATTEATGDEKTLILGYTQFPDTLYSLASQSSMTSIVTQFYQPGCATLLDFEFAPVCFEELPSLENGGLVSETVTIDPEDISAEAPVLINGEIITDGAQFEEPLELPQLTAQWTIKDEMKWQDGTPMTSDDFVFTFDLTKNPDTPVATRFTTNRTAAFEKIDDKTFSWKGIPGFVDPTYMANFVLDNSTYNVMPAHVFKDIPPAEIVNQDFATLPVAYGAFQIEEYVPQESITFVKNPNFYRAAEGLPKVERVIFKFLSDEDQVLAQLESGDIDAAGTIGLTLNSAERLDDLKAAGTHDVEYQPATVWEHVDFGIERGDGQPSFFDDAKVRQAMAYGINRQQIVDEVLGGRTTVMNTFQSSDYWAYPAESELEPYEFDPERAAELLDEAGWTLGSDGIREKDGRTFSVQFYTTQGNKTREQVAQIIQANLKEIGVDLQLEFVPATEVLFKNGEDGILTGRRFDMAMYAWSSGIEPSANLYLCVQIPNAENGWVGQNNPGYCNKEYDTVGNTVFNLLDRDDRTPFLNEAMVIFNKDLPSLPLYQRLQIAAWREGVTGIDLNASAFVDFTFPEELDITLE